MLNDIFFTHFNSEDECQCDKCLVKSLKNFLLKLKSSSNFLKQIIEIYIQILLRVTAKSLLRRLFWLDILDCSTGINYQWRLRLRGVTFNFLLMLFWFFTFVGSSNNRLSFFNLEGSLFKWANENRHMTNSEGCETKFAHPYNAVFGKLLNSDLRKS